MSDAGTGGRYDYVLVGGGLQSALLVMALLSRELQPSVAVVERAEALAGNHLWCFHAGDVPADAAGFVAPLVTRRFASYDVVFPNLRRTVDAPYAAVTSAQVDAVVRARLAHAPGSALHLGATAVDVGANRVALADGTVLDGSLVIDARGPGAAPTGGRPEAGFQTFFGRELVGAHGVERPVLMDATVPQEDGFAFLYLVPLAEDRLLIEHTRFGDEPRVDRDAAVTAIDKRAAELGLGTSGVGREEEGILPMPWAGCGPRLSPEGPLEAGYRGRWFHPGTGYSFPAAVRLAALVARTPAEDLLGSRDLATLAAGVRARAAVARFGNRLLFRHFAPTDRWHVLERFHRLPEPVMRRFYALESTPLDTARIFLGRPPAGLRLRPHRPAGPARPQHEQRGAA